MPHDHGHANIDPNSGDRRVAIAIWANGLLTVAQIVGGILSGSLALIADALHNFSDMASLVIAFAARKIARRHIGKPAPKLPPVRRRLGAGKPKIVVKIGGIGGKRVGAITTLGLQPGKPGLPVSHNILPPRRHH